MGVKILINQGLPLEVQHFDTCTFISQKYPETNEEECIDVESKNRRQLALAVCPELHSELEKAKEFEDLQKFKDYVHKRLDDAGIEKEPNGEHSKAGCRIGDRLDIVLKQSEPVSADVETAAREYCDETSHENTVSPERMNGRHEGFISGAKWQSQRPDSINWLSEVEIFEKCPVINCDPAFVEAKRNGAIWMQNELRKRMNVVDPVEEISKSDLIKSLDAWKCGSKPIGSVLDSIDEYTDLKLTQHQSANASLKKQNEKLVKNSMRWISVEEKHFIDIIKNDKTGYEWVSNENCPDGEFLVAVETNKGWDIEKVVMGEYGLRVVADDNDNEWQSWGVQDVTHWMIITPPKN